MKDWKFKSQIADAAVSISNNIAEGFDQPTTVNYIRYLHIAKASCNEVRSMSCLAVRLNYFSAAQDLHVRSECEQISKMLHAMGRKLKQRSSARLP